MKTRLFPAGSGLRTAGRSSPVLMVCVAAALSTAAAILLWLLVRPRPSPAPGQVASVAALRSGAGSSSSQAQQRHGGGEERWKLGERRVYRVDSSMHIGSDPPDPNSEADLTGAGSLALTVVTDDLESVVLRGELVDFAGTLSSVAGNTSAPDEAMKQPFRVTLTRRGAISSVGIHPQLVSVWHALLRTIVATTQFVEHDLAPDDRQVWQAEETDQLGRYRAEYRAVRQGVFSKTKGAYSHLELAPDVVRTGRGPKMSSKTELLVDANGLLRRAEAVESTNVQLGAMALMSSTRVILELKSMGPGDRGSDEPWMAVGSPLYENRAAGLDRQTELERKRRLVNGTTFATLADELRRLIPGSDERWAAMNRLSALFEIDP